MVIGPSNKDGVSSYLLSKLPIVSAVGLALAIPAAANAAPSGRQIEEVVVTAERQEASVQDTSISITAFTNEMLEDFGIKDQTDLQNFIPATIILPYDASVRGVGRNFRSLGGDPGISTYINSVYSEDLYTATIGSFWDMERIEILRGPQGTLYGRNAVGGAMNFLYNRPSQEFDYKFKAMAGNFDAQEFYGMVNGALIEDQLSARMTFSNRTRDGYIKELSGNGPDLDSRGEENYAGQLNWTPTDTLELNIRANRVNVFRVMGGADGGGLVVFRGDDAAGLSREQQFSQHGFRVVDPNQTDVRAEDFLVSSQPVTTFTHPQTGAQILAQKHRSGIDSSDTILPAYGFGSTDDPNQCVLLDKENIDGDDLCAYTAGENYERFHQQGVQFDTNWDVNDNLSLKYIYGYNKLSYQRITDDDSFGDAPYDRQFYVNHEATYESHEIQAFYELTDNLSFTSGIFFYDATIDQRGDFFDANWEDGRSLYLVGSAGEVTRADGTVGPHDPAGLLLPAIFGFSADGANLFSAKQNFEAANGAGAITGPGTQAVVSVLTGDPGGVGGVGRSVINGINTPASDLLYTTQTVRESMAVYTQGVWDINDRFTLTFGLRWAEDELYGEENLYRSSTLCTIANGALCGFLGTLIGAAGVPYLIDPSSPFYTPEDAAVGIATSLAAYNVFRGALDPVTLEPTCLSVAPDANGVRQCAVNQLPLNHIPLELSAYRNATRKDDKITYRINLDWDIDDNSMMYFSATTGYRGGGYNLVFFSATQTYNPEELIAYEIGYKGNLLDNTLQINASTYLYDYSNIHTFGAEPSTLGGTTTSVLEAPGAEVLGFEAEVLWLATDRLTIGGNLSHTPSEYTEQLQITDDGDPRSPGSLIPSLERTNGILGNQVLNVSENKGSAWAAYQFPLAGDGNLELLLAASWIDESFNSQFETQFDRSPGYERFDFRATWTSPDEQWIVTGFVNNIMDEIGIRQIEGHGEGEGFRRTGMVTEPRMYGVEVTYSMGN